MDFLGLVGLAESSWSVTVLLLPSVCVCVCPFEGANGYSAVNCTRVFEVKQALRHFTCNMQHACTSLHSLHCENCDMHSSHLEKSSRVSRVRLFFHWFPLS